MYGESDAIELQYTDQSCLLKKLSPTTLELLLFRPQLESHPTEIKAIINDTTETQIRTFYDGYIFFGEAWDS